MAVRYFRNLILVGSVIIISSLIASCTRSGSSPSGLVSEKILQAEDGSVALKLEDASCYSSDADPSNNTAEWNIIISKPGRYSVWLSSATTDTMNLQYTSSVKINLLDERIEAKPIGDKIVLDSNEVTRPWYRADSFMGTFYIEKAGEYNLQVISEKAIPVNKKLSLQQEEKDTRIMSVILTPMTR
jgi:hypothetical protein